MSKRPLKVVLLRVGMLLMEQKINSLQVPVKGCLPLKYFRTSIVSRHIEGHTKLCCYIFTSRTRVELPVEVCIIIYIGKTAMTLLIFILYFVRLRQNYGWKFSSLREMIWKNKVRKIILWTLSLENSIKMLTT